MEVMLEFLSAILAELKLMNANIEALRIVRIEESEVVTFDKLRSLFLKGASDKRKKSLLLVLLKEHGVDGFSNLSELSIYDYRTIYQDAKRIIEEK